LPKADPKAENVQQINLGREAFADREYGRAEQRFRQATAVFPAEPLGHFLLAQAQFALGKYQEAVGAIEAGMRRERDWPASAFRPRELYGANAGDFAEHFQHLRQALTKYPDDFFLLFLYAHQLWFDDHWEEARPFFQQARTKAADPRFSERFLQTLPPVIPFIVW
jgi:tetratricopeptide (TPR) repeat protein